MNPLDVPTPPTDATTDGKPDDSLELLRETLKAQRAARKKCLAKHKRTTFMAVETAKSTTYYDPSKLQERLTDDAEEEDEPAADS